MPVDEARQRFWGSRRGFGLRDALFFDKLGHEIKRLFGAIAEAIQNLVGGGGWVSNAVAVSTLWVPELG